MDLTKIIPSISIELNENSLETILKDTFKNHLSGYELSEVTFSTVDVSTSPGKRVKANLRFSKRIPVDPYTH